MNSQKDMFESQPVEDALQQDVLQAECPEERQASTCPAKVFDYGFLVVFNWAENMKNPFKMFSRNAFKSDILNYCMNKKLSDQYRIKKIKPLKPFPGVKVSMFCKVESCKY